MNRMVTDILLHASFFVLLWLGWTQEIAGARNVVMFWVALKVIDSLMMFSSRMAALATERGLALPYRLLVAYGVAVIAFFSWYGAFWLASAQTFNLLMFMGTHSGNRRRKDIQA